MIYTLTHTSSGGLQFRGAIYNSTTHPEEAVIFLLLWAMKRPLLLQAALCLLFMPWPFPPILYIPADSKQRLLRLFLFYSCLRTISTVVRNTNECQNDTQLRPKFSLHCSSINCLHEILTIQKWFGIFKRTPWINKSIALPQSIIHKWRQINLFLWFSLKTLSAVARANRCNF